MAEYSIYQDIKERSGGDVYIGVVGPVRTGKSTFIKKFMDLLVLPNMEDTYQAERTRDELPQSAQGRTIMTTEPKFIPNEAAEITLGAGAKMNVRMIDCVGYIVDDAQGYSEDDEPRMVRSPWSAEPIPFYEAAEIGTKKVITDHSTIGLLITTDGTITELPRESYISAETRVINELKGLNKPFVVLLNSAHPTSSQAQKLCRELENEHNVPVIAVNCEELCENDIQNIIETVLFEFPLCEVRIKMPEWIMGLSKDHWLCNSLNEKISTDCENISKICDVKGFCKCLSDCDMVSHSEICGIDLGTGSAVLELDIKRNLFYKILGEESGEEITGDEELISLVKNLSASKKEYDKVALALAQVEECGYGVVSPSIEQLTLEEPKIIKQGGRYGVKLRASAPSIHIIRNKPKFLKTA